MLLYFDGLSHVAFTRVEVHGPMFCGLASDGTAFVYVSSPVKSKRSASPSKGSGGCSKSSSCPYIALTFCFSCLVIGNRRTVHTCFRQFPIFIFVLVPVIYLLEFFQRVVVCPFPLVLPFLNTTFVGFRKYF